jgi:ribosomal protein S18 acetylase RimI-like enzyme
MRISPFLRPGRAADLAALVRLLHAEVRAGRRDSVPREVELQGLLVHFDWAARCRLVDDGSGGLAGAVLVTSRETSDGIVARIDAATAGESAAEVMRNLVAWSLHLSRAAGAVAAQVWVGPGYGDILRVLGLEIVRPWWRMDRRMTGGLSNPVPVAGYELVDGLRVAPAFSWADMHNRSFADHWSFSPRSEEELMKGKVPQLCLLAFAKATGEPAAVTLCQVETYTDDTRPQPVGLVGSVGTLPEHRRHGLASWLVAEGLLRLRTAGARHASLYVDGKSQTRAFDAYRKLGFELVFEAEVWEATFA